jgi:hypothetical protein
MTLQPWQQTILADIESYGSKAGEIMVMTAGRNVGKSLMNQQAIDRLMRDLNSRPIEELVLREQRFLGARFYTVEPIGGNWQEMYEWSKSVFGTVSDPWDFKIPSLGRWYANDRMFWFRNERDRTMFIMRWSGS